MENCGKCFRPVFCKKDVFEVLQPQVLTTAYKKVFSVVWKLEVTMKESDFILYSITGLQMFRKKL